MEKITTQWNLGNYTVALEVEATETLLPALASLGLRFLGQRNTEVDKVMGGFEKVKGKNVRKKNWKRGEVPFSKDMAAELKRVFSILSFPDEMHDELEVVANVGE